MIQIKGNSMKCPASSTITMQGEKRQCPFATAAHSTTSSTDNNNGIKKKSKTDSFVIMPPHPPSWRSYPILGHAPHLLKMAEKGELAPAMLKAFQLSEGDMSSLDIPGMSQGGGGVYFTSNADYARTVSTDLEHWGKITHEDTRGPFYMARQVIGDSLFVASDTEPNWGKAHRILMPAFSPSSLKSLADITLTKVDRLLERLDSSNEAFEAGDAFTSLTFDVIGNFIAGMDFGTTEDPSKMETDEILVALDVALRSRENAQKVFNGRLDYKMYKKRMEAYKTLHESASQVIDDRLTGKTASKTCTPDVLDRMLNTVDTETNEKMDTTLIRNHLILFLLVGHDSTSSLLTSLVYVLSQHPDVEDKIRQEVETVIGSDVPTMENIKKLTYTMAVIKETLRLFPPAVGLGKTCLKDTSLGPWKIRKGSRMVVIVKEVHKNPNYWGENPEKFDPTRFLPNSPKEQKHDYAWLPFSSGPRGCIGMQFSLIEARIILARMIPRFTFRLHKDAQVKEGFRTFMKLSNVYVTAHRVQTKHLSALDSPVIQKQILSERVPKNVDISEPSLEAHNGSIGIYFGSNTGTCERYAHKLSRTAKHLGFEIIVAPVDDLAKGFDSQKSLTLIVTSTYNGQPPNNAKQFARYCKHLEANSLAGTKVSIVGIGNSNWKSFQAFPAYIEGALRSGGAKILGQRGIADEEGDMQSNLSQWEESDFWPSVMKEVGLNHDQSIATENEHDTRLTISDSGESNLQHLLQSAKNHLVTVVASRELQAPCSGRSTKHIEFALPKTLEYEAGDHLAVFPRNDPKVVLEFGTLLGEVDLGKVVVVNANDDASFSHLPLGVPVTISDLIGKFVDLQAPATTSFLHAAYTCSSHSNERDQIQALLDRSTMQELRPLQVLRAFPSVHMTLETFLPTIAPMKQRYYSISSSPKTQEKILSITVGVVEGTSKSIATGNGTVTPPQVYRGVCSGHLESLIPGELAEVRIVPNERFRLPQCPFTPILMIGPGTGVAPFRGFLQDLEGPRPGMLFFGCRNEADFLYEHDLQELTSSEKKNIELHVAFSRPTRGQGVYVQDLLWEHRQKVWNLLSRKAHVYVCGDGTMAQDVDQMLCQIAMDGSQRTNAEAQSFLKDLQEQGRYLQDVWCKK